MQLPGCWGGLPPRAVGLGQTAPTLPRKGKSDKTEASRGGAGWAAERSLRHDNLVMNRVPGCHFSLQTRVGRPAQRPAGRPLAVHHWAASPAWPPLPSTVLPGHIVTRAEGPPAGPAAGLSGRHWGRGHQAGLSGPGPWGPALQPPHIAHTSFLPNLVLPVTQSPNPEPCPYL